MFSSSLYLKNNYPYHACLKTSQAENKKEEMFQSMLANLPGVVYRCRCDENWTNEYISEGIEELVGYPASDFLLNRIRSFASIIHPDDQQLVSQIIEIGIMRKQPYVLDYRICHADGTIRWVNERGQGVFDENGNILYLDGVILDINERKQAENKLYQQTQFLQSIWDALDYGIMLLDVLNEGADFRYVAFNPTLAKISPLPVDTLVGKTILEKLNKVLEPHQRRYKESVNKGKTIYFEEQFIFESKITWWQQTVTPLKDNTGKISQLVVTITDITSRKNADAILQQRKNQLKQKAQDLENALSELQRMQVQLIQSEKMSSLGQLVAGVAHEINNPVSFIHGNLAHAKDYIYDLFALIEKYQKHYPYPNSEIQEAIEIIDLDFVMQDLPKLLSSMKVGTERIKKIVLELRNFSRMDESESKKVNIHDGIDSTLMILENRLKAAANYPAIEVIKEYGNLSLVECYPGQLNQVFLNILSNAIESLRESTANNLGLITNPQISIRTEMLSYDRVIIRIADNGLGMAEALRKRVFDPFFTTKAPGKGTGMGLSICYQIVTKLHVGNFQCISSPGNGAEFVIEIPIKISASTGV
jgi:PAS domain S-box-containing protein